MTECLFLKHYPSNLEVVRSIPDGVIKIFHEFNFFGHIMALGPTQPITEMSARDISWGEGVRCVG
jgi:hypothetical protein